MGPRRLDRRAVLAGSVAGLMAPAALRAQTDPMAALVDQVDGQNLYRMVHDMAAFPSRWTEHPRFPEVTEWLAARLEPLGGPVTRQVFELPSGKFRHNIVAGPSEPTRSVIIVGAHYDSISETPETDAPGANDNATGIAALSEVHRILSGVEMQRDVICIAFAGEEQGYYGSTAAANIALAEGWDVELMLNLDMLGHRPVLADAPMIIEFDQGNTRPGNDAAARTGGRRAAELAVTYTTLNTAHSNIWGSDYMPFEAAGFPCIGLYDNSAEGGHYHTTNDTADRIDYPRLEQATRLAVAIVADQAGVGPA